MATRYRSPEDAYKRGLGHILANVPLYNTLPPMAVGPSMVGLDTAGDLSAIEYYFWDGDSWEQVTIGSIEDRYVKVSADDTVAGYLEAKTAQGTGISLSTTGGPGDEDLVIAHAANASAIPSAHHTVFTTAEHGGVSPQGHHVAFVKADADALYSVLAHLHDDRYYTEAETDAAIDADVGTHAALATGVHGVGGSTVASVADLHDEAHDIPSHTDVVDATGAQLETLTGGGETALHSHAGGDVVGPAGATDHALARFDTATGKLLQDSPVICDDAGNITGVVGLTATGNIAISQDLSLRLNGAADANWRIFMDSSANINVYGAGSGTRAFRIIDAVGGPATRFSVNLLTGDVAVGGTVDGVDIAAHAADPDAHGGKVSKSYLFEFPTEDMAVGDFIPENAIRIPATGKHGGITWGTAYARCETVGAGTNTILFRTSTTLTGARTTRATINLGTAREASGAVTLTETDGMYLWVECSAVGGTAPKKVTVQVDCEEAVY